MKLQLDRPHVLALGVAFPELESLARLHEDGSAALDAPGDIMGLAKPVAKTCRHRQLPTSAALFARCAIFRALDPVAGAGA